MLAAPPIFCLYDVDIQASLPIHILQPKRKPFGFLFNPELFASAESEGFEPPVRGCVHRISSAAL